MALPSTEGDGFDPPPAAFHGRRQGGQKGQLAGTVTTGDLSPPGVGREGVDELFETLALFEDKIDRARPQPRAQKGLVRSRLGRIWRAHVRLRSTRPPGASDRSDRAFWRLR